MSNKQKYISVIRAKIAELQKAEDAISGLPDKVFDDIFGSSITNMVNDVNKPLIANSVTSQVKNTATAIRLKASDEEYGKNKKTVLNALKSFGRPLTKSELVNFFEQNGYTDPSQIVTNAIVALKDDNKIKGYKPHGLRFRGLLWTLKEWWDNGELKAEYNKLSPSLTE